MRLPILYSEVRDLDESAVTCLFPKVKDTSKTCVMLDYERRFPTNCEDIAYVVRELAEKRLQVFLFSSSILIVPHRHDDEDYNDWL